jgi:hypothetical protein
MPCVLSSASFPIGEKRVASSLPGKELFFHDAASA